MACLGSVRASKTRSRGAAIEIWQVTASLSELICEVGVMLNVAMRHRFLSLWYAGGFHMPTTKLGDSLGKSPSTWRGLFFCRYWQTTGPSTPYRPLRERLLRSGMTVCFIF